MMWATWVKSEIINPSKDMPGYYFHIRAQRRFVMSSSESQRNEDAKILHQEEIRTEDYGLTFNELKKKYPLPEEYKPKA